MNVRGFNMHKKELQYLETHRTSLLNKLNDFIAILSVSTDYAHIKDMHEAADFVKSYLDEIGFDHVEKQATPGHPLVYAEYKQAGPDAPTVLVYGHYDVQPVDALDEWVSDDFTHEVSDGRLYS